jgi:hypothetical protein
MVYSEELHVFLEMRLKDSDHEMCFCHVLVFTLSYTVDHVNPLYLFQEGKREPAASEGCSDLSPAEDCPF